MLDCQSLSGAEAVTIVAYVINRCPSTALNFKILEEVSPGHPRDYSKLRVFGCLAYAHVKGDKLEPRALRCIFLGYLESVKAYKLWCLEPCMRKSIVIRDVVFNEAVMGYLANKGEGTLGNLKVADSSSNSKLQIEVEPKEVLQEKERQTEVSNWHEEEEVGSSGD